MAGKRNSCLYGGVARIAAALIWARPRTKRMKRLTDLLIPSGASVLLSKIFAPVFLLFSCSRRFPLSARPLRQAILGIELTHRPFGSRNSTPMAKALGLAAVGSKLLGPRGAKVSGAARRTSFFAIVPSRRTTYHSRRRAALTFPVKVDSEPGTWRCRQ